MTLLFTLKVTFKCNTFYLYLSNFLEKYFYFFLSKKLPEYFYFYSSTDSQYFKQHCRRWAVRCFELLGALKSVTLRTISLRGDLPKPKPTYFCSILIKMQTISFSCLRNLILLIFPHYIIASSAFLHYYSHWVRLCILGCVGVRSRLKVTVGFTANRFSIF